MASYIFLEGGGIAPSQNPYFLTVLKTHFKCEIKFKVFAFV